MFENVFSRRKGYTPPPGQGTLEKLSEPARKRLWNIFFEEVFKPHFKRGTGYGERSSVSRIGNQMFRGFWTGIFGKPVDEYPGFEAVLGLLRPRS
jgi:hypothetical protein